MSILTPTDLAAEVVWLGLVPGTDGIEARAVEALDLDWGGPVGDVHHGLTRGACVRVRRQYAADIEIRNVRQVSIVSEEELAAIAEGLGVARVRPEWLGATVMVRGLPALTDLPPASRLIAGGTGGGPALVTDTENAPCRFPAEVIERNHPGRGLAFPRVARHRRGITAWVERPGGLALGDRLRLHLPVTRPYRHHRGAGDDGLSETLPQTLPEALPEAGEA